LESLPQSRCRTRLIECQDELAWFTWAGVTMGHIRLGRLPRSKHWQGVVDELDLPSASSESLARETFEATSRYLRLYAANEHGCYRPLLNMTELAVAARTEESFWKHLRNIGVADPHELSGIKLLHAILVSTAGRKGKETRTDLSEIADQAYREILFTTVQDAANTLWDASAEDVRIAFREFTSQTGYSEFVRNWFSRFVGRTLLYFLDRELPNHIGSGKAVETSTAAVELEKSVVRYAHERTRIIRDFAPGWLSKTLWQKKTLSLKGVRAFFQYCIKKITDDIELESEE